jgi:biotin operon repressor
MSDLLPDGEQLLGFFKALADANRLKIIGLLAQKPFSVEELAAMLDLRPSTISHHLGVLNEAGLTDSHTESYYNLYQLRPGALESLAKRLLAQETFPSVASGVNLGAYDQRVLSIYLLPNGRLKTIPAQRKKREAVLRHVIASFKPDVHYTEKQVNKILSGFHEDVATLRRELIAYKMLARESGEYWRIDQKKEIDS